MYRQFISQAERQRIIDEYDDDRPPHCNDKMFHKPGVCAFCDGYYRRNGEQLPRGAFYVFEEANGWGGNRAPTVDAEKAAEEDAQWQRIWDQFKN